MEKITSRTARFVSADRKSADSLMIINLIVARRIKPYKSISRDCEFQTNAMCKAYEE